MAAYYKDWAQAKPDSKADEIGFYSAWTDKGLSEEKKSPLF